MDYLNDYADAKEAMIRLLNINPFMSLEDGNGIATVEKLPKCNNDDKLIKVRYRNYRSRCKELDREFNLTFDQFKALMQNACYYCGDTEAITIDRKDSDLGYTLDNAVSCCSTCNSLKTFLPIGTFIQQVMKIAMYQSIKN